MFFTYSQNNTGGSFDFDADNGIGVEVIIEADTPFQADNIAMSKGIYFGGATYGADCDCCGDRWYRAIWGDNDITVDHSTWGDSYIHYRDGSVIKF